MSSLFDMTPLERDSAAYMHGLNKSLIAEIYAISKEQGISQKDIADRLVVNKSVISRLLQGRGNPTFRTVSEICAAIGVRPTLSFSHQKSGANIGRGVSGRAIDPISTSQSSQLQSQSFSFSSEDSSCGASGNV